MKLQITKKQFIKMINEELESFISENSETPQNQFTQKFASVFVEALEIQNPIKEKQTKNDIYKLLSKYINENINENANKETPSPELAIAYVRAFAKKNGYVWEQFTAKPDRINESVMNVYFMTKKGYNFMGVRYVYPGQEEYNDNMAQKTQDGQKRLYGEW